MDVRQRVPGPPLVQAVWNWPDHDPTNPASGTSGASGPAKDDATWSERATASGNDVPSQPLAGESEPTTTVPNAQVDADTDAADADEGGGDGVDDKVDDEEQAYRRRFKARTCRICLETIEPTFDADDDEQQHQAGETDDAAGDGLLEAVVGPAVAASLREGAERVAAATPPVLKRVYQSPLVSFVLHPQHFLFDRFRGQKKQQQQQNDDHHHRHGRGKPPRYVSEDPDSGRLFSPCHCRGSQKYVHEGCLQAWRHAAPLADRNFWTCPTCKFSYRIERLRWARLMSGTLARVALTLVVFLLALFCLGFVADPLIAMWQDPGGIVVDALYDLLGGDDDPRPVIRIVDLGGGSGGGGFGPVHVEHGGRGGDDMNTPSGWIEHFVKGLLSLGVVGAVRTVVMSSPVTWWVTRANTGAAARGRRRGNSIGIVGWSFVLWGAIVFLQVTWKGINRVCGFVLDRASDRIVAVGADDDDDVDEDDDVRGIAGHGNHAENH